MTVPSHLPVTRTLGMLGIPRTTFYRWYDRYEEGGPEALEDRPPRPARVWNRIPEEVRKHVVQLALDEPELSPRELPVRFTDTEGYFISEATVYRLLKAHDLITRPSVIVMKAVDEFADKTTNPNSASGLSAFGWAAIGPAPFSALANGAILISDVITRERALLTPNPLKELHPSLWFRKT